MQPAATAAFETALRLHEQEPSAFERARTELCYGESLRRAGQRRRARDQLRSALVTFERISAEPWAERCRSELRASGEHIRLRDPTVAERLTPQEFQIALVIADGLTNRDAASRLFLSPKTVEFHLTRIYRKLGIHSRSEASSAGWWPWRANVGPIRPAMPFAWNSEHPGSGRASSHLHSTILSTPRTTIQSSEGDDVDWRLSSVHRTKLAIVPCSARAN